MAQEVGQDADGAIPIKMEEGGRDHDPQEGRADVDLGLVLKKARRITKALPQRMGGGRTEV